MSEELNKLRKSLRIVKHYTKNTEDTIVCCDENVDEIYKKTREAIEMATSVHKYEGLCDNCQYTACWDKGKAIRCKMKHVAGTPFRGR